MDATARDPRHPLHQAYAAVASHWRDRLAPSLLTPNDEIHVLQIVREALSNVMHHARAGCAWVRLEHHSGRVEVVVAISTARG